MVNNNLLQVQVGEVVRIQSLEGGKTLATKFRQYGLFIGDQVRVLRQAPFDGPLLLEVNGREIALGHGIAARVIVEAA